jgi:two-component system response regulator YesN
MIKVMLVEDELLVRSGMRTLFNWGSHGFDLVAEASNGEEALQILRDHAVDIVITDIRMPVMDGLELIAKIRGSGLECEIIVLSSYDDFQYVRKAMQMGVSDYIHKPTMTQQELMETLKKTAEKFDKHQSIEKHRKTLASDFPRIKRIS